MCLTKEQIDKADDLKREKVSVPEWGGHVYVRMLDGDQRGEIEEITQGVNGKAGVTRDLRSRLSAMAMCDDKGVLLYDIAGIKTLGKKCSLALDRVFEAALKINKMGADDIEETAKNLKGAQKGASG